MAVSTCTPAILLCTLLITSSLVPSFSRKLSQDGSQATGGLMLPLYHRQGVRGLLKSGTLPVLGAVREVGYFYTKLYLGTPAREFSLIVDTGSTITYVPCSTCLHCGVHTDDPFNPQQSSTYQQLGCKDNECDCGNPRCSCQSDKCYYYRSYAEKSTSEGWLIKDRFLFPDNETTVPVVFGCEQGETGEIFKQKADGILGIGNNNIAFHSQLVNKGIIEDTVSLCFAWPSGGAMLLGDVPLPEGIQMSYTPLVHISWRQHYYNVRLDAITVGGQALPINRKVFDVGYGTVVDSGTTFTYIPTKAYQPFYEAVNAAALAAGLKRVGGADPKYQDVCWSGAPSTFEQLGSTFPDVEFVFGGNAAMKMPPFRYLFLLKSGTYCLGIFDNGEAGILIGGISVRNLLIQYDRRYNQIGFGETDCAAMSRSVPSYNSARFWKR